jgi:hypothetical protein
MIGSGLTVLTLYYEAVVCNTEDDSTEDGDEPLQQSSQEIADVILENLEAYCGAAIARLALVSCGHSRGSRSCSNILVQRGMHTLLYRIAVQLDITYSD